MNATNQPGWTMRRSSGGRTAKVGSSGSTSRRRGWRGRRFKDRGGVDFIYSEPQSVGGVREYKVARFDPKTSHVERNENIPACSSKEEAKEKAIYAALHVEHRAEARGDGRATDGGV